ncbi:MAG: hypothetical protein JW932_01315 [Deltaproteobacteria bacterium]|nr:hypothetical protein [Deltaproteobacteria bacterium]
MRVQATRTIHLFMGMMIILTAFAVWAEEEKPTASADVGISNKYVWRGYELSDDSIVIQPSTTVSHKNMSLNLWGNIDSALDDTDPTTTDKSAWEETDFTLSYGTSSGPVDLEFGYIYYGLDGLDDTQEIYASASMDIFLAPSLTIYKDIGAIPGWYFSLGISHSIELSERLTLDLSGSLGYYKSEDDGFVEVDSNLNPTTNRYEALHDGNISVSTTLPFGEYITMTPMVAYSFPLSDEADYLLQSTSFEGESDYIYGGVTFSIAF